MNYALTEHARDALATRQIEIAWVERALTKPELTEEDRIDPELEHHLLRIPEFENRLLRVIVNGTRTPPLIVTAFFDRRKTL